MKDKPCSVASFSAYLQGFDLRRHARQMSDARCHPEISPASVFLHRAVGCQILNSPVKPFLAIEWLRAKEGCAFGHT